MEIGVSQTKNGISVGIQKPLRQATLLLQMPVAAARSFSSPSLSQIQDFPADFIFSAFLAPGIVKTIFLRIQLQIRIDLG